MLQCQVGQIDLLGQSDGHLATVTREGPAVARCHIGLEGAGARGLCWVGREGGFLIPSWLPLTSLALLDEPDLPVYKASLECHHLQEASLTAGSKDEPSLSSMQ